MTELPDLSVAALAEAFGTRAASPVEAARAVLERIDAWEPTLRAVTHRDDAATLRAAAEAEARWRADERRGGGRSGWLCRPARGDRHRRVGPPPWRVVRRRRVQGLVRARAGRPAVLRARGRTADADRRRRGASDGGPGAARRPRPHEPAA